MLSLRSVHRPRCRLAPTVLSSNDIKRHALEAGFDLCGIAPAEAFPELQFLKEWLASGYAATMGYMPRTAKAREDVRRVLPTARSVVALGVLYNVDRPSSIERSDPAEAIVSRYAWGDDYHDVLSARIEALLAWMRAEQGAPFDARVYVDTGPVQERVYARHAGLGWIGKNTCLINEELGSWLFLGEIICSLPLEADEPAVERCGTCTLCLEACPTGALRAPGVLDAARCLSYLTIELKREIPEPLREALGRRIFGCDICQDVCPYNLDAPRTSSPEWLPRPGLDAPTLATLWRATDPELATLVAGTPMTRPTLVGLRRNLAVAIGNCRDATTRAAVQASPAAGDPPGSPSGETPLVREHLAWARRRHGAGG